jgi:hypothetical protein
MKFVFHNSDSDCLVETVLLLRMPFYSLPGKIATKIHLNLRAKKDKYLTRSGEHFSGGYVDIETQCKIKQTKTIHKGQIMSDLNDPLKESYIGKVGNALTPYADELKAGGFDASALITQLTGAGKVIEAADKVRQDAEKAATTAIINEHTIRENFYTQATGTVSLVEGVLGKDHALTVKLRGLRADLIGNQGSGDTPEPAPAAKTP